MRMTHYPYISPKPASAVIQPVCDGRYIYVLTVMRNKGPKKDGLCLPSGYVENDCSNVETATHELEQETGIQQNYHDLIHIGEATAPPALHVSNDNIQSRLIHFYQAPMIATATIDFDFRDKDEEIAGLDLVHLDNNGDALRTIRNEAKELCFLGHQAFALNFLQKQQRGRVSKPFYFFYKTSQPVY